MSSVKRPWPVRKRKSSLRLTLAPIPVSGPESGMVLPLHARGGRLDGLDDVVITRAAADVALQPLADLVFLGIGVLLQKVHGGHHHARRAEAALQPVMLAEGRLHGVQRSEEHTSELQSLMRSSYAVFCLKKKKKKNKNN